MGVRAKDVTVRRKPSLRSSPRDRITQEFGRILRDRRVNRGLSQAQLAVESGVDRSYIGHIEAGAHSPTLTVIFRLATVLKQAPSVLIERLEGDMKIGRARQLGTAVRRRRRA